MGGDTHFRSAHQPIRVPGTVYHKGGLILDPGDGADFNDILTGKAVAA
ncbi:MAG: hypothetical protein ACK4TB_06575 [Gemmobacter sp.]